MHNFYVTNLYNCDELCPYRVMFFRVRKERERETAEKSFKTITNMINTRHTQISESKFTKNHTLTLTHQVSNVEKTFYFLVIVIRAWNHCCFLCLLVFFCFWLKSQIAHSDLDKYIRTAPLYKIDSRFISINILFKLDS